MRKVVLSGACLVAGFLLFCVLHVAQSNSRNPIFNFTWMLGSIIIVLGLVLGFIWSRKESVMPIVASIFSFAPILLLLLGWIPLIGDIFLYSFFVSVWGIGFCIIGLILGIISLCREIKHRRAGIALSIIAILAPFAWVLYLYIYMRSGGNLLL